jgi:valyl-tRNA synthetase
MYDINKIIDASNYVDHWNFSVYRNNLDLDFTNKRLENPNFVARAKSELVEQERENARLLQEKIRSLQETLNKL